MKQQSKDITISGPLTVNLAKGEMICAAGENMFDLFIVHKGKLMVFVNHGTKVTPLAFIKKGEYLGELSFFDKQPRSAHVVCVEDTSLVKVPVSELEKQFPQWLISVALNITKKIRQSSDLIRKKGIRRQKVETIKPLTMEDQRHYYQILKKYLEANPLGRDL